MLSARSVTIDGVVLNRERTFEALVQEYKNRIFGYVCRVGPALRDRSIGGVSGSRAVNEMR